MSRFIVPVTMWVEAPSAAIAHAVADEAATALLPALQRRGHAGDPRILNLFVGEKRPGAGGMTTPSDARLLKAMADHGDLPPLLMRTVAEATAAEGTVFALNHLTEHLNAGAERHGYHTLCNLPVARRVLDCGFCLNGCPHCGFPEPCRRGWRFWRDPHDFQPDGRLLDALMKSGHFTPPDRRTPTRCSRCGIMGGPAWVR